MSLWSSEIKELETQYKLLQDRFPDLEKELEKVIKTDDVNMVLLYSRRCLEVIITDLCECELNRPRKTEPLKGIIDKLLKEQKVPTHIITSMDHLNTLSAYGAHPKDFDPEQVKPVLNNLDIIIKWYLKYKENLTIESVKTGGAIHEGKSSEAETKEDSGRPKKRLIFLLTGILLAVVIIIVALLIFDVIGGKKQAKALEKSIAVLPFINDSPDEENTYFINGLMDEVLNNLQKIKEISVVSRTSVEQFRDPERPAIPDIARKLDVNYIVEGSGQKYGNTVRLRIQLIDGNKDKHLWAESYEREIQKPEDIFNIQSQIAQSIASELKVIITPEEQQLIEKTPTTSLTAYDLYQKGNEQRVIYLLEYKREALDKAEKFFREALKYDSSFARAYSGLAQAYIYKNRENVESYFSESYLDSALILANTALLHDDQLAEAYYAKGIYYVETNINDQALKEFDKALEYNPSYWEVYLTKGTWIYVFDYNHTDYVKAFENINKAISLNHGKDLPGLLRWLGTGYISYAGYDIGYEYWEKAFKLDGDTGAYLSELATREWYSGNREKSIELDLKVYNRDTNNVNSLLSLGKDYEQLGRYEEALKYYEKYIKGMKSLGQLMTGSLHRIGYVYWQKGYKKEAEYYLNEQKRESEEAIRKGRSYSGAYYDLAGVYAFLGQKDKAYENLRIWARIPIPPRWWVDLIKEDHLFDGIRNEPEFQQIVRDLEAKYQAEHERVGKWMKEQGLL